MMKLPRRTFLHLAAGAGALPAFSRISRAQAYPGRSVHIIVGFAPGSVADILSRLIGKSLSERLGQPFVIPFPPMKFKSCCTERVSAMWCGNVALGAPFGGPINEGSECCEICVAVMAVAISACIAFVLPSVLVARPQAGSASLYIISGAGGAMVASYGDLAACTEAMNSAQERPLSGLPPPASLICVSNK